MPRSNFNATISWKGTSFKGRVITLPSSKNATIDVAPNGDFARRIPGERIEIDPLVVEAEAVDNSTLTGFYVDHLAGVVGPLTVVENYTTYFYSGSMAEVKPGGINDGSPQSVRATLNFDIDGHFAVSGTPQ